MIKDLEEVHPFKIKFKVSAIIENEMGEKLQRDIFRIVQEQMNNIIKHADASKVVIKLSKLAHSIVLVISDDGIGCEISKAKGRKQLLISFGPGSLGTGLIYFPGFFDD